MASQNPAKFGDHSHCGSGDIFLMVEGQNSARPCSIRHHYCLSLNPMPCMLTHTKFHGVDTKTCQCVQ